MARVAINGLGRIVRAARNIVLANWSLPTPFLVLVVTTGIACLIACIAPGETAAGSSDVEGKTLFQEKCSGCHTVGGGRLVGPDLKGVTTTRSHEWLEHFISAPDRVIAGGDPAATQLLKEFGGVPMPNLGLSEEQVDALLAFLAAGALPKAAAPTVPTETAAGDPRRGAALFSGTVPLGRGGAPCLACHSVSGVAPLGGGSLGPDLTGARDRLGAAGLSSVLATLPFPTMRPVYQNRPLTPTEREDLAAFFRAAAGRRPVDNAKWITVLAVAGTAFLLILAGLIWRKRLRSVRRALVTATTESGGDRR